MTHLLTPPRRSSHFPGSFGIGLVTFLTTLGLGWTAAAADRYLPAFPGAEGYGAFTPGGRGGKVLFVTTLDDYNPTEGEAAIPGSFRQAVETPGTTHRSCFVSPVPSFSSRGWRLRTLS